jgi:Tol biopolymer transport system component
MPYVLAEGKLVYFSSSRINHHFDIFRAESKGAAFATPTAVDGVNDPTYFDGYPVVSADERTMYFGTARINQGYSTQIWVAQRASSTSSFRAPTLVTELAAAGTYHDYPSWLSPDGCRLYFTSSRVGSHGAPRTNSHDDTKDLWVAERHP